MATLACDSAAILAALPQTQCQRCGWPDCASYAQAIVQGQAAINQCPPGGQAGVARLAAITGLPEQPLDPAFGQEQERTVAFIDEDWCIGCTLCVQACPVDAIVGGNQAMPAAYFRALMHTIKPLPNVPLPPRFREKLGQRETVVGTRLTSGSSSATDILVSGQDPQSHAGGLPVNTLRGGEM